ncbi:MAG TPA: glycosyltransferase family 9 protein [Bacteroidota bacterium]|nr:glycosyltransferase family 9 protein [Bacteroidota bacterium]
MTQGIGDVVCSTVIIAGLRRAYPGCSITGILKSETEARIFGGETVLDGTIFFDPNRPQNLAQKIQFVWKIIRSRFDLFIVPTDLDAIKSPFLALISGASRRVGERSTLASRLYSRTVPREVTEHKVLSNRRIAEAAGGEKEMRPSVYFSDDDRDFVQTFFREHGVVQRRGPIVIIHPGSGPVEKHKRWNRDGFALAADRLISENNATVILVGGKDEAVLCDEIVGKIPGGAISVAGKFELRQTAALFHAATVALGSDSGMMHVAAAAGAPTVVIFGPTDPARTAPFHASKILWKKIHCSPCYPALPLGCGNTVCLEGITADEVVEAVRTVMSASLQRLAGS